MRRSALLIIKTGGSIQSRLLTFAILSMLLPYCAVSARPQSDAPANKLASEKYRNIQVLNSIPADDLMNTMNFMAAALKVNCNHCHVPNQFEKDDKPAKQTARRMIQMMRKLNQENFDGRAVINCYSCHSGKTKPALMPPVMQVPAMTSRPAGEGPAPKPESKTSAAQPPLPSSEEILKKYMQALGGEEALKKLNSREAQGHLEAGPRQVPVTLVQKFPNRWLIEIQSPEGTAGTGYDGKTGWSQNMRKQVSEESGKQLEILKRDADFHRAIGPAAGTWKVTGLDKTGDTQAYVVEAASPSGYIETLFFDVNSGLLLRSSAVIQTPLGPLPFQQDFEDYREIDGIKFPFLVRRSRAEVSFAIRYSQVRHNIPVADTRFEKPKSSEK